jgi:multidrug efflux pump subunit AcrB
VSVTKTISVAIVVAWLMAMTTTPRAAATMVSTRRLPERSIHRPMPKQNRPPISVAARLICA